jgi:hypothetical protein
MQLSGEFHGNRQPECRTLSARDLGAANDELASMLLDDPMREPQPQSRPFALRRHIGLEQIREGLRRHAGTIVGNRYVDSFILSFNSDPSIP